MHCPHLFVDLSAHGLGHLAQVAPVLQAVHRRLPALRLTVRSGLARQRLAVRLPFAFTHIAASSDFGYVMHDAVELDLAATARTYRRQHADWPAHVTRDAHLLTSLQPDLVLSNVSYLPLAAAAQVGIPSQAMCSLNWADLFAHFYGDKTWAAPLHRQMLAAYNRVEHFYCLTPGMPMPELEHRRRVGPVAEIAHDCRQAIRAQLLCPTDERVVLIAFGGVSKELPLASWPPLSGVRWLVPRSWAIARPDVAAFEPLGRTLPELLRAADAVLTKPGYGTFSEAVCNGTPVLYLRRPDWPEQDFLIDWLQQHGRSQEVGAADLAAGCLRPALAALWRQPLRPIPEASGVEEIAAALLRSLAVDS